MNDSSNDPEHTGLTKQQKRDIIYKEQSVSNPNDKLGNWNYTGLTEKTREEYREDVKQFTSKQDNKEQSSNDKDKK